MRLPAPLIPATLSFWLLAAHALRAGHWGQALAWALVPGLFLLRQAWVRRAAQAGLGAGILLWADTGATLVRLRLGLDQPWGRLAAVIAAVMVLAAWGMALLESRAAARRFDLDNAPRNAPAWAFALTAGALILTRTKVPFPVLLPDRFLPGSGWLLILGLSVYAALAVRWFLAPGRGPKAWSRGRTRIWGLFSLVFFGQLSLGLAGAERFLMTGALHLPVPALIMAGPIYRGEGFFMPVLFLSTVALVGPAWCSWLCYIGAWDARAAKGRRPAPLPRRRQPVRVGLTLLTALAAWGLRAAGAPVSVALFAAAVFGLAGVAVMLTLSRRAGVMVHCTAYCPMGVLANVLGKLNPFRIRIREGCTGCGTCARACRYDALDQDRIALGAPRISCTLCGDCVSACPHGSMGYDFPGLSPDRARALFTVLAVGAHAVFLGVARI